MYAIYSSLIDLARKFQGFSIKFCKMADDGGAEGSDTVSDANNQVLKPNVLKAKLKNDTACVCSLGQWIYVNFLPVIRRFRIAR